MEKRWGQKSLAAALTGLLMSGTACADSRPSADGMEFPRETAALVDATVDLFEAAEAVASGDPEPVVRIGSIATPARLAEPDPMLGAFPESYGPVRHLTGYRITWYPVERLIGAVDFMGTWDRTRNLVCGYVAWDLSDPDAPALEGIVTNYVDLALLDGADRSEIETVLLEANCAFGDIEANYAVFE